MSQFNSSLFDPATVRIDGACCLIALGWWSLDEQKYHHAALHPKGAHAAIMEDYKCFIIDEVLGNDRYTITAQGVDNGSWYRPNPEYRLIGMEL